jgi:hypothetical protein
MLNVVTLAYQGKTAKALLADGMVEQQRKAQLFADYTDRVFARWPITDQRYSKDQAISWLAWLARSMRKLNQSEFDLDRLQPEWLPTPAQRRLVTFVPALLSAAIGGLLVSVVFGLVFGPVVEQFVDQADRPVAGLTGGPGVALTTGLVSGLVFALVAVGGGREPEPVRQLRWPWLGYGLSIMLFVGPVPGLALGLVVMGSSRLYELARGEWTEGGGRRRPKLRRRPAAGPVPRMDFGLVLKLALGLALPLIREPRYSQYLDLVIGFGALLLFGLVAASLWRSMS